MKVLLIGKTGQLGGSILKEAGDHHIFAPNRSELDIEDSSSFERMVNELHPDVVINTAAFHNVPLCEQESLRAFAVNCQAVRDMAAICKKNDIRLVTFSTDYVFSGEQRKPYSEEAKAMPLQIYGISRLAGELTALATAPQHAVIIRTCGLYGFSGANSKGGNFVEKRLADAKILSELEMGCDQVISPTYTGDLAQLC